MAIDTRLLACLIVAPQQGYDEPEILSYAINPFCPMSADGGQLMTTARDYMSKADTVTIAAIETGVPNLVDARTLTVRFQTMFRATAEDNLRPCIAAASQSLIASFAAGISKDISAVRAALTQPWSN